MTRKEAFYQAEGLQKVCSLTLDSVLTVSEFLKKTCEIHNLSEDSIIFFENESVPLNGSLKISELANKGVIRLHVNRCRQLKVHVNYNGIEVQSLFAPSITIGEILKWATVKEFKMAEIDASEFILRISGQIDVPKPNIHVGSLVTFPKEQIFFDLNPKERVQGNEYRTR